MKLAGTNRGSALMLVVGLLTIVAMLGSTFLIASYLEAQQAVVITTTSPVPPLTNGVFSELQQVLKFDEFLAPDLGKFGQLSRVPKDWKKFVDMPGKAIDQYLTDISTENNPWLSKVFGDVPDYGKVDTDGDDEPDAWLYNVRVTNTRGDIYYMALRVIDLSGLMCINTAGDRTVTLEPKDPAMVDLKGFLGDETYRKLSTARSGTGSSSLEAYAQNCGRRMLSPVSGYTPFPFADEVVLRWRERGSDSERSKLYEILQDQGDKVTQLTTISSSQSIMRYPGPGQERPRILLEGPHVLAPIGKLDNSLRLSGLMTDAMGSPDAAVATGKIVDNPGPPATWVYKTDDPNRYGPDYLQNPADAVKGGVFPWMGVGYTFTPTENGDYVVSCRAPKSANSAPAVTVCAYHTRNAGATVVYWGPVGTWNQTLLGNQWIDVGLVKDVLAGDMIQIRILAAGTEGFVVNADAVKLTRKMGVGCPEAYHFAANAWAYCGLRVDDNVQAYAVSPDGVWMAYGVLPQMVITEVFLHSETVGQEVQWARAIELLNPTEESIVSTYRITCGGAQLLFDVDAGPGERIVLWTTGTTGAIKPDPSTFNFSGGGTWIPCSVLDNFPANELKIERFSMIMGLLEVLIPVDSVLPVEVDTAPGTRLAERDDSLERQRCLIPKYVKSSVARTGHTLGAANMLSQTELATLDDVLEGFYIRRIPADRGRIDSVGDLAECYLVGPDSTGVDLPHKLYPVNKKTGELDKDKRAYHNKLSRGRANIGFTNPKATAYPDVPWGTLVAEFVETVDADPTDGNNPDTRIFGRININTAPLDVLARLPYPATITVKWQAYESGSMVTKTETVEVDPYMAAQAIMAYRDSITRNQGIYMNLVDPSYNKDGKDLNAPTNLRFDYYVDPITGAIVNTIPPAEASKSTDPAIISNTKMKGFLTPGEVAIPLAVYGETLIAQAMGVGALSDNQRKLAGYLDARDALYRAVISSVTVNSDTFGATAVVNVGSPPRYSTNYLAIIDTSNCQEPDDSPSVVFLTEIK